MPGVHGLEIGCENFVQLLISVSRLFNLGDHILPLTVKPPGTPDDRAGLGSTVATSGPLVAMEAADKRAACGYDTADSNRAMHPRHSSRSFRSFSTPRRSNPATPAGVRPMYR